MPSYPLGAYMTKEAKKKRLSMDLDADLAERIEKTIPYGVKSEIIRRVLEMIVDAVDEEGHAFVGALLTGQLKLTVSGEKRVAS